MSYLSYSDCISDDTGKLFALLFLIPILIRQFLRFKAPIVGVNRKCYFQMLLLSITLYLSNEYPCYFTHVAFIINLNIFLLAIVSANNIAIGNYFELFNVFTFFSLTFTTCFFWCSICLTWLLIIIKNISSEKSSDVCLALLQLTSGSIAIGTASSCILHEFYILLVITLILLLIQVELKTFFR